MPPAAHFIAFGSRLPRVAVPTVAVPIVAVLIVAVPIVAVPTAQALCTAQICSAHNAQAGASQVFPTDMQVDVLISLQIGWGTLLESTCPTPTCHEGWSAN